MKILLITIDAWRASHASFMPESDPRLTPNLAAFATNSAVFTQAIGHGPATPYAFPALFTSTLPLDYGGYERISEDRPLVSEALAGAGYRCVGVHGNPWLGAKYGYGRGYADYDDVGEFSAPGFDRGRELLLRRFGLDHPVYRAVQYVYRYAREPVRWLLSGTTEVDVALEALRSTTDDQFTWMHLLTPHAPYTPPTRHRDAVGMPAFSGSPIALVTRAQHDPTKLTDRERAIVRGLYAASVRHADEQVSRLLSAVDDDTLVIVTADHGEALFDHGQLGHEPALYDELIHVPLLIRAPDGDRVQIDTQVGHLDIAPTILDYAGVEPPDTFMGQSLRPALEGDTLEPVPIISEVASTAQQPGAIDPDALTISVRLSPRKLLFADGKLVGFDLETDPLEQFPLAPAGQAWEPLKAVLSARLERLDIEHRRAEYDRATEDRLRSLGYLE